MNSPSDWHTSCFGCFDDRVEALQTLIHGAVYVLLAEQLGRSTKYGHLSRSCFHLMPGERAKWVSGTFQK